MSIWSGAGGAAAGPGPHAALWRLARLQVSKKRHRRRGLALQPRPLPAMGPNQVWAYDFVFDACANGQPLDCLLVVDEWTHEALTIDVQGSIRSRRVIEVLLRLVSLHGAPRHRRSDHGPEFVSHALLAWLRLAGVETALISLANPEWRRREPKREVPRRVSRHGAVPEPGRGPGDHRDMVPPLQRGSAAFEPRVPDPQTVQGRVPPATTRINPPSRPQLIGGPKQAGRSPRGVAESPGSGSNGTASSPRR